MAQQLGYWRTRSRLLISQIVCANLRRDGETDEAWAKRLKKALTEGYPYAQRSGFAYQSWLKERSIALYELGLRDRPKAMPCSNPKAPPIPEGQLSLFDLTPPSRLGTAKIPIAYNSHLER